MLHSNMGYSMLYIPVLYIPKNQLIFDRSTSNFISQLPGSDLLPSGVVK